MLAHRVAWEVVHGEIPAGLFVCHACDNPLCVNSAHLFLGTHGDNMRDMRAKGRGYIGGTPGEKHPLARLTATQVLEARRIYAQGGVSYRLLGARFGVSGQAMGHAVRGETWRCLGE
jgi:hypothetical protein